MGRSLGTGEHLGLLEESETSCMWLTGQSETYTDGPCCGPTHLSLRWVSTGEHGDKVLELGVRRVDPEKGLLLIVKR